MLQELLTEKGEAMREDSVKARNPKGRAAKKDMWCI